MSALLDRTALPTVVMTHLVETATSNALYDLVAGALLGVGTAGAEAPYQRGAEVR
jgi:hypothetical protein